MPRLPHMFSPRSCFSKTVLLSALAIISAACSPFAPNPTATPRPTQKALPISTITPWPTNISTLEIADRTPTHTLIPASTNQILPIQTSTLADLESLPRLRDMILSSADIEQNYGELGPVLPATEVTNELQGSCLWECVKYRYSLKESALTIVLLRAGDPQKAEGVVANLREDFLKPTGYEYLREDLIGLEAPLNSWVISLPMDSHARYSNTVAAGAVHGTIVILVTYSQDYCQDSAEPGSYCEGDLYQLGIATVYFLNTQIRKLETAGYPK